MNRNSKLQITHFGLANLDFSSYFVSGMQAWAQHNGGSFRVVRKMPANIVAALENLFRQGAITVYEMRSGRQRLRFSIDGMDNVGIHEPLLDVVDLYFKVNLCQQRRSRVSQPDKILPCLPFFPVAASKFLNRPRILPFPEWGKSQFRMRMRQLIADRPTIDDLQHLRSVVKQQDVSFVVPYYDADNHKENNEFRYQIMRRLAQSPDIDAIYGFVGESVPAPYDEFLIPRVSMRAHLERIASSRVAVYVQGVHCCISFKFGELLALGLPIAGQTLGIHVDRFTHLPGFQAQFSARSPAAVVESVGSLLADKESRESLAQSNARVFDEVLSPECVAADVVEGVRALLHTPG